MTNSGHYKFFNSLLYFFKKYHIFYLKMDKITLRLKPGQMQVIEELREALGANTATIIRAIISDFLVRNEDILERIIVDYQKTGNPLSETNQILNFQEDDE